MECGQENSDLELDGGAGSALYSFLDVGGKWSFWRRTWIVQEIALAKKATSMCEDTELE